MVGYPIGGDTISVTSGVVSRIEVTDYDHGSHLLGIQIDAAINFGNSGARLGGMRTADRGHGESASCAATLLCSAQATCAPGYVAPCLLICLELVRGWQRAAHSCRLVTARPCRGACLQQGW